MLMAENHRIFRRKRESHLKERDIEPVSNKSVHSMNEILLLLTDLNDLPFQTGNFYKTNTLKMKNSYNNFLYQPKKFSLLSSHGRKTRKIKTPSELEFLLLDCFRGCFAVFLASDSIASECNSFGGKWEPGFSFSEDLLLIYLLKIGSFFFP